MIVIFHGRRSGGPIHAKVGPFAQDVDKEGRWSTLGIAATKDIKRKAYGEVHVFNEKQVEFRFSRDEAQALVLHFTRMLSESGIPQPRIFFLPKEKK